MERFVERTTGISMREVRRWHVIVRADVWARSKRSAEGRQEEVAQRMMEPAQSSRRTTEKIGIEERKHRSERLTKRSSRPQPQKRTLPPNGSAPTAKRSANNASAKP